MKPTQKVGIIGAGVSGLVTAKTMREHGFSVVVFEREAELGGVWASTRRYPNVTTQNTRDTYTFSDFPMPKHYPNGPPANRCRNTSPTTPDTSTYCRASASERASNGPS
nr:NAD(P)-binding protein [Spirosoma montaniterrae]